MLYVFGPGMAIGPFSKFSPFLYLHSERIAITEISGRIQVPTLFHSHSNFLQYSHVEYSPAARMLFLSPDYQLCKSAFCANISRIDSFNTALPIRQIFDKWRRYSYCRPPTTVPPTTVPTPPFPPTSFSRGFLISLSPTKCLSSIWRCRRLLSVLERRMSRISPSTTAGID